MIGEKMQKAFSRQINAELYSAYLYQSMNAWCQEKGLEGFANWMQAQVLEEIYHAMKMYGYVFERGGLVTLDGIERPPAEWESPLAVAENILAHERKVTGLIYDLVDLAASEKDHASSSFLGWFVEEQVEEEATAEQLVGKLRLAGDQAGNLFMVDKELATRVFRIPPDVKLNIVPKV
jgi:ferritin